MKQMILFTLTLFLLGSCATTQSTNSDGDYLVRARGYNTFANEPLITQSLFADNNATISEENIQKILDGTFKLPEKLRVAVVKLESSQVGRTHFWRTDEEYLKTQQSYLDLLSEKLKSSQRVEKVSVIPDILISSKPTFVTIREAAVRTQADVVAIFSINSEIYTRERAFSSTEMKAFATTQFILLDVKTGLIPFSTILTKDYQSQRTKGTDLNDWEARNRVKNEAVLLTLNEIGKQLVEFLEKR
jgi:hypothetical protein